MNRSWLTLLLLAVLVTTCNGLLLTWPPPNYSVTISSALQIMWRRTADTSVSPFIPGYVTIYLTNDGAQGSNATMMATGISDSSGTTVVYVPYSVQPGTYYIFLNDTNPLESIDVGGPYNFIKLAAASTPAASTPSLTANPAESTSSKTTTSNSGWNFGLPLFMVPVIIIIVLVKVGLLVYTIRRRGWRAVFRTPCCGRRGRRQKIVVYETRYVVYNTEVEGSQTQIIGHSPVPIAPYPMMYEGPEYPSRYSTHTVSHAQAYDTPYSPEHPSTYPTHTVVYPPTHISEQPPEYRQSKYY
ncbi:hypothetical protein K450DRAFT_232911 [Umbelopsis ramanniana AG]|uniref:Fibronectin type-III domain-containing protein n=1 Tax=Umbelopsis ramanniana AG TaxID=1314678 RepID=A0AAD5HEJ9_UMBRA|nr:uncharacterized protein K450DRAFT_232911 [Umbelopsis ramanniana AG]KAI8581402.1 hypothetical protein K450DRAFT_232911 [Umbelopsis ramanniana AG]